MARKRTCCHATGEIFLSSSRGLNQAIAIFRHVPAAVKVLQLRLQIGEARREIQPEPVQDGKVGLPKYLHEYRALIEFPGAAPTPTIAAGNICRKRKSGRSSPRPQREGAMGFGIRL